MEFKRILNMSWFALLSLICISSSTFGSHYGPSIERVTHSIGRRDAESFPMDLMTASASAMQNTSPPKMKIDDDKKTLSQQVADGKYGLIQKELFKKPFPRPGVLSYDGNSEVPKDNANNFGGLNKSDIWLAENHLLVLKGGVFPLLETLPEYSKPAWPPIDDFDAPRRQVKLPKHPKVPPPFPVQLTDGGPLQILGTNFTRTLNDSFFSPPYAVPPLEGYDPGSGPFFPPQYPYPPNATSGEAPFPAPPFPPAIQGDYKPGDGQPPQFPFSINGGIPPFFDSLPPGSAILPPPNITDQFDEDDLSIYYPPPYSFYYPKDNTTEVPPGPLVPGIVLPPPPDFFGVLGKYSPPAKTTSTTEASRKPYPVTTSSVPTAAVNRKPEINTIENVTSKPRVKPVDHATKLPEVVNIIRQQQPTRNKSVNVTVLRPVKPTRKPSSVYIYDNNVSNKPFAEYGPPPPRHRSKISITTTKVPLRAYFGTSRDTLTNLVTSLPKIEQYTTRSSLQKHRSKPTTQIYYYDDTALTNSISTPYPINHQNRYINLTKEYYTPTGKDSRKYTSNQFENVQQLPLQPQYYYLPSKSYITQRPQNRIVQQTFAPNTFQSHIVKLQEQLKTYQRPSNQYQPNVFEVPNDEVVIPSPKPVYQYSFEVANYQEQHDKLQIPTVQQQTRQSKLRNLPKYSVQIEPAVELTTTERPFYQNTPAPIYYREENYRDNSQRVPPQKYYTNSVPEYNYQEQQKYSSAITPHPLDASAYTVTPNPVYQTYYTKQDEQYFDDITKKYFTTFGKKLSTSTTPIPTVEVPSLNSDQRQIVYAPPQENPRIRTSRPFIASAPLKGNVVVNYLNQEPTQNLQAEYVQYKQPQPYPQVAKQGPQFAQPLQQMFPQNNADYRQNEHYRTNQNYRKKIPQSNVDVQTIQAISIPARGTIGAGKAGSFISYELPGDDGAHFYFLTPQLTRKDNRDDVTYYYTQPSDSRI